MSRKRQCAARRLGVPLLVVALCVAVFGWPGHAAGNTTILQEGDSGDDVLSLQLMLAHTGDFTVEPTGYFGPLTAAALAAFQARHGLTPSGVADPETWTLLSEAVRPTTHVVAAGETLSMIAWQYDLTVADLVAYNDLADPDFIVSGMTLRLVPPAAPEPEADPEPPAAAPPAPAESDRPAIPPGLITVFGSGGGRLALTFNDGPDPAVTPQLLDALAAAGAKATFFVVGERAAAHPDLVRRIVAEGHELANHSQTHRRLTGLDVTAIRAELAGPREVAADLGLTMSPWFRPPEGRWDDAVLQAATAEGLRLALWTNIGPQQLTAPLIARRALAAARPEAVLLLHDGRPETVEALELILAGLAEKGLQAVTLSQLAPP